MNSSSITKQIKTDHKDLIQDIAFDFYGKRVATASLDQSVKIWTVNENNEWIFKEQLKINTGLHKVVWAHPEFGSLIAVACDRTVWIYEEASFGSGRNTLNGWVKHTPAFTYLRAPITDLKFAPKQLGLQLATCSQNGEARIYECTNISSPGGWHEAVDLKPNMTSCSSCSWSSCFNLPILLALGCDDAITNASTEKLSIFEYNENDRTCPRIEKSQSVICSEPIRSLAFAPSIGKLYHVLAIASRSLMIATIKPTKEPHKYQITLVTLDTGVSAWRVCWNTIGSVLASAGDDRKVRLWRAGTWKCFAEITGDSCTNLIGPNFNENAILQQQQQQQLEQEQN
jgi:WD40 repeat protein